MIDSKEFCPSCDHSWQEHLDEGCMHQHSFAHGGGLCPCLISSNPSRAAVSVEPLIITVPWDMPTDDKYAYNSISARVPEDRYIAERLFKKYADIAFQAIADRDAVLGRVKELEKCIESTTGEGSELPPLLREPSWKEMEIMNARQYELHNEAEISFVNSQKKAIAEMLESRWNSELKAALSSPQQESPEDAWRRGYEEALYQARRALYRAGRDVIKVKSENVKPYLDPPVTAEE
jgi:hypothetical protein